MSEIVYGVFLPCDESSKQLVIEVRCWGKKIWSTYFIYYYDSKDEHCVQEDAKKIVDYLNEYKPRKIREARIRTDLQPSL